jgi:hypothetical protein
MLKDAIDTYLAVRRAAGFKLIDDAFYLYHSLDLPLPKETHMYSHRLLSLGQDKRELNHNALSA